MGPDAAQSYLMVDDPASSLRDEIAVQVGNLDPAYCFQCGVCSGSCPTVDRMEYGPRRIMHMIRLGLADQVLRSRDIWLCVSCFSCSSRCPQQVDISEVMSVLRNLSIARGVAKDEEAIFSRTFVDVLQRHGRMYEMEVLLRYYASKPGLSGLVGLVKQAGLGIGMFRKGKIALRPERIEDTDELKQLAEKLDRRERH
ncbi:MAG: 4Fe-4S dicluster domain-containing protein [Anaerolineae bacterium]|jgi:heterodisulfide reductase subunit C